VAVVPIICGISCYCIAQSASLLAPAQVRTGLGSKGDETLVVVAAAAKATTIRFGEKLDVLVTLQNQGKEPVSIPHGALLLKNAGWTGFPGGGSGLGESTLNRIDDDGAGAVTLQPGESVAMSGSNAEMAAKSMGPMKADFIIETKDDNLARLIKKPARFSVEYYVAPSKLIASAWSAKTAEERLLLQPQIRDLLLLGSRAEGWRDRFFVEGTHTFMGCHALPLLEFAMKDADPVVRRQAVLSLPHAVWAAGELNAFIASLIEKNEGRDWAASVGGCDETPAIREGIRLETAGLGDADPRVRIAAIVGLTDRAARESNLRRSLAISRPDQVMDERTKKIYESVGLIDPALPLVQKMAADEDAGVRSAAQKFLSYFASNQAVARGVAASLADPNPGVRAEALRALKSSHEPPPMETIEQAFAAARGEVGLGLIGLLHEREDANLPSRLSPGINSRTAPERLMILTAIAGHTDDTAFNLVAAGLKDKDSAVQRGALMRLLEFPAEKATSLIKAHAIGFSSDVREVATSVQRELESRALFPFLADNNAPESEKTFPSTQGTGPMISPDGKWLAYTETGWGRPGGSGGFGRSNLISLVHVAGSDGSFDHIVSDMFLVGWLVDSGRLATARDGFAAVVDLNGGILGEFGETLKRTSDGIAIEGGFGGGKWPTGEVRAQLGVSMPHSRRFQESGDSKFSFDFGEDAACSPDGKWFGPRRLKDGAEFVDLEGHRVNVNVADSFWHSGWRAFWSPDGAHVILVPLEASNYSGDGDAIQQRSAPIIDFAARKSIAALELEQIPKMGEWDYRKGRWNPWSKDGKHLAFVRRGQIWIADADGGNARQLTFDASNKAFPTFSPDGNKIAYVTWQFDNRELYARLGPTDIWVVDCATELAARLTRPNPGHIEGLDWLDGSTLIFDRLDKGERHSSLKTLSLR
jgi:HEAT repeat protein